MKKKNESFANYRKRALKSVVFQIFIRKVWALPEEFDVNTLFDDFENYLVARDYYPTPFNAYMAELYHFCDSEKSKIRVTVAQRLAIIEECRQYSNNPETNYFIQSFEKSLVQNMYNRFPLDLKNILEETKYDVLKAIKRMSVSDFRRFMVTAFDKQNCIKPDIFAGIF